MRGQNIVFYRGADQHVWETKGRGHDPERGCYFCRPQNFPPMLAHCSLCCCCGNVIVMPDDTDPMNDAMRVCRECQERFDREERDAEDDAQELSPPARTS